MFETQLILLDFHGYFCIRNSSYHEFTIITHKRVNKFKRGFRFKQKIALMSY